MNRTCIFICLLFLSFSAAAQNITISGKAKSYENKEIGVWVFSDHLSKLQKQITWSEIDSAGNFLIEFNSKEIQYITLKVKNHIASMYVEPDTKYEVILSPPDSTTYQNPNIDHDVKLSINLKSKTEINSLTMDYDKRFDDFLSVEYKAFVSRSPQAKIDSFQLAMHSFYSTVKNNYFNGYIAYTIAALKEKTKVSEKKLYEEYLQKRPLLYDHPEYMNFFNSFYKQKVQQFALSKSGGALFFQINDRGSFSGAMDVLKRDTFLDNDTIRELVLIKGLFESYHDGSFKKPSVVAMLQQVSAESKIQMHQKIAQNMLNSFSKLQKGTAAPFFELPDKTGRTHSLDELRSKKYVYVMFFDETCNSCLQQMKVIPALKKIYGERIEFLSILTEGSAASLTAFSAKNPKYDWQFLYDHTSGKLKTDYEIRSLPAYFLISPEGKFVQVPADSPDEDIERIFYDITKIKSKLHNVGSKVN